MATLPDRPDLDQLRSQARELLNAARAGDGTARHRVRAVSDRVTLATAQLAIAREYGFASWSKLKAEVEDRRKSLAELADEFCAASIRDWTGRAARLLASHPELAGYSLATAILLGDAERVRAAIRRDPGQATRPDTRTGWTPLHAVAASRWHRLDPARADGLVAVARLLLDAGADPSAVVSLRADQPGGWTPLRCAVAGAVDVPIVRLLLSRGARPEDHDLYLAGFADDDHECLRLLLDHAGDLSGTAEMALAAPISTNDVEGVRLLLDAGADPRRFVPDNPPPAPVISASVQAGCSSEIVSLLLIHGADPNAPGPDGLAPITVATRRGRSDLRAVLRSHGAIDAVDDLDRFLGALVSGDDTTARGLVQADSSLLASLTGAQQAEVLVKAAEAGNTDSVRLMLELGFSVDVSGGDAGGTALHAAAYAGAVGTVRLLLDHGADVEARDETWNSTPLVWAAIGSGEHPTTCPDPDWLTTVRTLLAAGASTEEMTLSPGDPKPPDPDVSTVLREHGVASEPPTSS